MIRLTKEEVLLMHEMLIESYGGIRGIRDENLLDSALNAPFQGYGEFELYPSLTSPPGFSHGEMSNSKKAIG